MATMVADHLRFLWPTADGLFVVGRLAFPLFCLAIAVNVQRARAGSFNSMGNVRYLELMLLFAVLSEPAYRWLDGGSQTLNVMPTLVLGLLVAWGVHYPLLSLRLLGLAAGLAGFLFSGQLMYGVPGVLLPGACLMARRQGGAAWVLPCLLAMGGNLTNSWLQAHLLAPITLLTLLSAASALALGSALLRHDDWRVPAVGRWGYLFYPVHLLVIKVLS